MSTSSNTFPARKRLGRTYKMDPTNIPLTYAASNYGRTPLPPRSDDLSGPPLKSPASNLNLTRLSIECLRFVYFTGRSSDPVFAPSQGTNNRPSFGAKSILQILASVKKKQRFERFPLIFFAQFFDFFVMG